MGLLARIRRALATPPVVAAPSPLAEWRQKRIQGSYDAARTSTEFENYWANADRFDADSAHSREVRHTLMSRARYAITSNGFSDGIAQTYATDMVGVGPLLRMQTASTAFNQMVEREFYLWSKAIRLRRKLWCMAHAKHCDGEAIAVMRRNPSVAHPIKLDLVLYEADQCQTPYLPFGEKGYIDGIKFDEFGNPLWYDILREHPGGVRSFQAFNDVERVPADRVLHWFKMRRPGQHRGVPEAASTLNVGAASHRMREATLAAAETAADLNVMLTTQLTPDTTTDPMAPFSSMPIQKRMMTAAPMGWEAHHFKSEHPNATYAEFLKTLINEQGRSINMPLNKSMCNSADYNYASGRLDHQTYYGNLDIDREDGNDLVLDPLFDTWFNLAIGQFGWLGGDAAAIGPGARVHLWDWPKHRVADVEAEANANQTKLKSGQAFPHQIFTEAGMDFDDEVQKAAVSLGVAEDELRKRVLDVLLPPAKPEQTQAVMQALLASLLHANGANRLNGHPILNGAHHEN